MRANAAEIKTWAEWNDATVAGPKLCASVDGVGSLDASGSQSSKIEFPVGSTKYVRYSLKIERPVNTLRIYSADLKVWERTGVFYNEFYTEFAFGGR